MANWKQVANNWDNFKTKIQAEWDILTDAELDEIGGDRDQFVSKLKTRYGMAEEQAERKIDAWLQEIESDLQAT